MVPFILPNLYNRLSKLPKTELSSDSNYYDFMEDLWFNFEPGYEAFYTWARQRSEGEITDLGCGDGNVGRKLSAKYYYDFLTVAPGCMHLDLNQLIAEKLSGDTFILSHVLEHLKDPKKSLQNLYDALDSGNRIIISVPDAGVPESTAIPYHQYIPHNDMSGKHLHHLYAWTTADLYNTLISQGWDGIDMGTANICGFACIWALAIKP